MLSAINMVQTYLNAPCSEHSDVIQGRYYCFCTQNPPAVLVSLFELGGQAREDVVSAAYTHDLSPEHCVQLADLWSGLRTWVRAVCQGLATQHNQMSDIKQRHLCHVNAYDKAVELI